MSDQELRTPRLLLRAVGEADIEPLAALSRDPRVNRHSPGGPPSLERSEATVRWFVECWRVHGIGYWTVRFGGDLVGVTGVMPVSFVDVMAGVVPVTRADGPGVVPGPRADDGYLNLYYRFSPAVWGRGIAAEAVRAAMRVADASRPEWTVIARTRPANAPAARLALAVGLRRAAELDAHGMIAFVRDRVGA